MRRLLAVLLPLVLLAACGDDDAADGPTTTLADVEATPADEEPTEDAAGGEAPADRGTDDASPETTAPGDAPAQEGPTGGAGEDEGLGDAVLASDLDAGEPVPGPGQAGATGRFEAELVEGTLCVDMVVDGLDTAVTETHLHSGRAGDEGPVVVDLGPPSVTDGSSTWSAVCVGVPDEVIEDLAAAPELAYVDVHTGSHPDGAVRGQLMVISIFDRTLD